MFSSWSSLLKNMFVLNFLKIPSEVHPSGYGPALCPTITAVKAGDFPSKTEKS
jgi:hypothetical protein